MTRNNIGRKKHAGWLSRNPIYVHLHSFSVCSFRSWNGVNESESKIENVCCINHCQFNNATPYCWPKGLVKIRGKGIVLTKTFRLVPCWFPIKGHGSNLHISESTSATMDLAQIVANGIKQTANFLLFPSNCDSSSIWFTFIHSSHPWFLGIVHNNKLPTHYAMHRYPS